MCDTATKRSFLLLLSSLFGAGLLALVWTGAALAQGPDPIQVADSVAGMLHRANIEGSRPGIGAARTLAERALTLHPDHPLLLHYVGESLYREAALLYSTDEDAAQELLDRAQDVLDRAIETGEAIAETYAVKATVMGMRIGSNPLRAMTIGPRIGGQVDRAVERGPENPRVWLVRGSTALHTPAMFGGGPDTALEHLDRAVELFAVDTPVPGHPRWGAAEVYAWIGQAHLAEDRPEAARAAFLEALRIEPDYGWVRAVLLPAAEQRLAPFPR